MKKTGSLQKGELQATLAELKISALDESVVQVYKERKAKLVNAPLLEKAKLLSLLLAISFVLFVFVGFVASTEFARNGFNWLALVSVGLGLLGASGIAFAISRRLDVKESLYEWRRVPYVEFKGEIPFRIRSLAFNLSQKLFGTELTVDVLINGKEEAEDGFFIAAYGNEEYYFYFWDD